VSGRADVDFARFVAALQARHPWLPAALGLRLARAYGSRVDAVIGPATALAGLGAEVAPGLHEAELRYLQREEWACGGADVLWRRSKLGLHYDEAERRQVTAWMETHLSNTQSAGALACS
jgi:glycerol-3-phosphate dehydrogenase